MIFAAREPFPLVRPGDRIAFTAKNLKVTITHIDCATAEKFRDPPVAPLVFEDDKPAVESRNQPVDVQPASFE